jgi:hypothetical protein
MRVTLLVLGMVLGLGLVAVANDGSVAWPPIEGQYAQYEEIPFPGEPGIASIDWQCFKACWKYEYKACAQGCFWVGWIPWIGKACLTACALAASGICAGVCWY